MVTVDSLSNQLLQHLAGAALRSVCLAAAVFLLLAAIRRRSAQLQHAAWSVVLVCMLLLPLANLLLPSIRVSAPIPTFARSQPAGTGSVNAVVASTPIRLHVTDGGVTWRPGQQDSDSETKAWAVILAVVYLAVALALLARLLLGVSLSGRLATRSAVIRDTAGTRTHTHPPG
jgi:hypothetical protein